MHVIICHKNIFPRRQFRGITFGIASREINFYVTDEDWYNKKLNSYKIKFDGTNLSKIEEDEEEEDVSSRYSQLTVDEVLTNLNNVVYKGIQLEYFDSEDDLDNLLNIMKLVTTKTGGRFCGRFGHCDPERFDSKLVEILDNYIIVDKLALGYKCYGSYIREVCANPEIVQLPSTPKEIRLARLRFEENEEVLNFTCNGKLNGANRLTIEFKISSTNFQYSTNIGNFIRQWFELYRTHQSPISLIGKFVTYCNDPIFLDALKTFLNNTQLSVKYSFETKEFYKPFHVRFTHQYLNRRCVLHETDSYSLVIEIAYREDIDMSSINASNLDQPPWIKMKSISFCVNSL